MFDLQPVYKTFARRKPKGKPNSPVGQVIPGGASAYQFSEITRLGHLLSAYLAPASAPQSATYSYIPILLSHAWGLEISWTVVHDEATI